MISPVVKTWKGSVRTSISIILHGRNIYANSPKIRDEAELQQLDLALRLHVTGSILLLSVYHQHFYKGLCMCSCHVEELC